MTDHPTPPPLELRNVGLRRGTVQVLSDVNWTVGRDERWVVLGANGCGKTSLIRIAALYDHPSTGTVRVLGELLGRADVRVLRRRIGFVSSAFADLVRPDLIASDVVMCSINVALEPWWHTYTDDDRRRAVDALDRLGIARLATHRFASLSSGERQRVQLARALMCRPSLLLLDEPTAGLDLAGREEFVADLDRLAADGSPMALVTHHLEEIPASFTHALVLGRGTVLASGPVEETVTSETVSEAAGIGVRVERRAGRWSARAV